LNTNFSDSDGKIETMADAVLTKLDADRMVIGHTVQVGGVNSILDGKIWRVDVSDGYNNRGNDRPWRRPLVMEDYMYVDALVLQAKTTEDEEQTKIVKRKGSWRYSH
jgi:hypothetical protein